MVGSIIINTTILTTVVVVSEVTAVRTASEQMMDRLRKELGEYRILLITPRPQKAKAAEAPPEVRVVKYVRPRPLVTPNPRILQKLDPGLAEFVKDNPAIENIITREIVRDVDAKVLNLEKLLTKSRLEVSFEVNDVGHVVKKRMEVSST